MTLRVLVTAAIASDAGATARALREAAESLDLELDVDAAADPASVAGPFDCLVCAGGPVADIRRSFPDTPLIRYLDSTDLSRDALSTVDHVVQRSGDASALALANRVIAVAGGSSRSEHPVSPADRVDEAVFALDTDWQFTSLNGVAESTFGRSSEELLGAPVREVFETGVGSRFYDEFHRAMRIGEPSTFEAYHPNLERHFDVAAYPVDDGLVVYMRDVTDRKRQEDALSGVLETTRALMQARTREEVAELLASAAKNTLGFEYNVVRLYDPETETLVPVGSTSEVADALDERPVYGIDEGMPGEVFRTGEARRVPDLDNAVRGSLASAMYLPIGVHGTISIGATEPDAFDETDQQVGEILATNAAVAFSRAKREQDAREARDRVETLLDRINGLVRNTVEVLVQATTREEIEHGVPEQLTVAAPYAFAWLGTTDVAGETLSASAWHGDADLDVTEYERDLTAETTLDPSAEALETRAVVAVDDLDDVDESWAREAVAADLASLCAVPLNYRDTVYGVVTVYADEPDAFDEREQVVLQALGRAIAGSINAVERGRILSTDRVVEMELSSRDPTLLFARLSSALDCRLESAGTLTQSDDELRLYVRTETDDADAVGGALAEDDAVSAVTHVVSYEGTSLFEISVTQSVVETLADYGAVTKALAGEDGTAMLTIELPHESEARDIYDLLSEQYDDLELVGYHEHDRPVQTHEEFRAALRERFTDRQETALRSAYLGGFFEWPRTIDGDDLAQSMDITRPTYHQHLRAAQKKVFEELF